MRQEPPPGGVGAGGRAEDDHPDTDEIRDEIVQTRAEMSGTIDAIQQRLAPETLNEQAKELARDAADQAKVAAQGVLQDAVREVKDAALEVTEHAIQEVKEAAREVTGQATEAAWGATVGRAEDAVANAGQTARGVGSMVIDTIKQNPIPAAIAAISIAWLYMKRPSNQNYSGGHVSGAQYRPPGSYQAPRSTTTYPPTETYPLRTGYAPTDATRRATDTNPPHTTVGIGSERPPQTSQAGQSEGMVSGVANQAGELASDVASSVASGAGQVMSSATDIATSAGETAMDTGSSVIDLIKRNPVPAAMVGLGIGWLYMNRSTTAPGAHAYGGTPYLQSWSQSGQHGATRYSSASASQGGVGDMARQVGGQVGELASSAQEQAGEIAGAVMDRTTKAPGQIQRLVEDSPFMAAALAASVGAAVGLVLPTTQTENQVMGSTRDRVMGKAQQITDDTIEKVSSVAQEVQATASKEARTQGLTV